MNKEEFKLRIMKQLRNGETPIHSLMFRTGKAYNRYVRNQEFWVEEYGLIMKIVTLDDNAPAFQVMFRELQPGESHEAERTLSRTTDVKQIFAHEILRVHDKKITFDLEIFCVKHDDYLFSYDDLEISKEFNFVTSWSYDLVTGQFIQNEGSITDSMLGVVSFVELMKDLKRNPNFNYLQAMVYNSVEAEIKKEMDDAGLSDARKKYIISALNTIKPQASASAYENHTFFMDFILDLNKIESRIQE